MSRFLLTGVNPVQCGHRPKLDYISSVKALVRALEASGHQVTLRPVELGEDLAEFDRVVVFLAPMRGFLSVHTLGALWALYAASQKCTISFDDWQVREALHANKSFAAQREDIIAKNPFGYRQIEKVDQFKTHLWEALDAITGDWWPWPALVPVYAGGDMAMFGIPQTKVYTYNPSVLFKGTYGWVEENSDFSARTRSWNLAALHNHEPWLKKQGVTWPVRQLGHKKSKQERVPESQLFVEYQKSWGMLSPAYKKICGSGWWRARYGFAADALVVISGDPKEMSMVDPECYPAPAEVESCSDAELLALARIQREAYYAAAGTLQSAAEAVMQAMV